MKNDAPDDSPDLERLRAMDETAWRQAFNRLWSIALQIGGGSKPGKSDAEDVAAEALRDLVQEVGAGEVGTFPGLCALLHTIVKRRAVSHRRRQSAAKRGAGKTESFEELAERTDGLAEPRSEGPTPLQDVERAECIELLREVLQQLQDPARSLLQGNLLDGKSYKELSAEYSIPLGTVGSHISRGLSRIRDALKRKPKLMQQLRDYLR